MKLIMTEGRTLINLSHIKKIEILQSNKDQGEKKTDIVATMVDGEKITLIHELHQEEAYKIIGALAATAATESTIIYAANLR